jgi:hypothetical protein
MNFLQKNFGPRRVTSHAYNLGGQVNIPQTNQRFTL